MWAGWRPEAKSRNIAIRPTRDLWRPYLLKQLLVTVTAVAMFAACASDPEPTDPVPDPSPETSTQEPPPAMIVAERGGFIPEGVEYDMSNGRILTGSLAEGSVFELQNDGRLTTVVSDPDLVSSVGIEVDELRDRRVVANSDLSVFQSGGAGQAKLGVYNLTTGERISMVDLAASVEDPGDDAAFFANDAAVADDGTIYVTDTRMGLVYAVDGDYEPSVLHRFDGFAPNGIVHHAEGYLLVAGGSSLWKVPLDDPSGATEVALPEEIPGQDGMVWTADGRLAIVSNSGNRVVALTSADGWTTAHVAGVAPYETQATTAAVVGDDIYVVHPHFADEDPPSVTRVTFQ